MDYEQAMAEWVSHEVYMVLLTEYASSSCALQRERALTTSAPRMQRMSSEIFEPLNSAAMRLPGGVLTDLQSIEIKQALH